MEAVLHPLVPDEVIEGYDDHIPLWTLLDKDPNTLTAAELDQINNAQNQRWSRCSQPSTTQARSIACPSR